MSSLVIALVVAIGQGDPVPAPGLALLRRDGFASMDAGPDEASLTTRVVRFNGKHLFVNAAAGAG